VPQDHATLLAALMDTTLTHGDTVLVGPGTYTGPGNRDLSFEGKDLVVRSTHGAAMTILDLQGTEQDNHRGFLFHGGIHGTETRAAVLDGFTILNGLLGTPAGPTKGGAPPARLQHDLSGAGIMCRLQASPTIRNMIIRNCSSEYTGGGIGVEFISSPYFENVVVQGCTSSIQGGGASVETVGQATFVDCVFTGNSSRNGGGLAIDETVLLQGCVIADNTALRGAGIDVKLPAALQMEHTILWNNCAVDSGSQMYVDPVVSPVRISCSAVDTLGVLDRGGRVVFEQTNVFTDPQFCEPAGCLAAPTTAGQYTVREGSPCLPAGNACGQLIGAFGNACSTPVETRTMSQMKSLFR